MFKKLIVDRNFNLQQYEEDVNQIVRIITRALKNGYKLYFMGNGGSAAEATHIAAEFSGRFLKDRKALPAESLSSNISAITAIANDYGYENIFKRQIEAFVEMNDVVIALTTSGNSENLVRGIEAAKEKEAFTICFSGNGGGKCQEISDIAIIGPNGTSAIIQELHLILLHIIVQIVEENLFQS